jgi:hypothetical protein
LTLDVNHALSWWFHWVLHALRGTIKIANWD